MQTSRPISGIFNAKSKRCASTSRAFSMAVSNLLTLLSPNPSIVRSSEAWLLRWNKSAYSRTQPRLINFCIVCSDSPSILIPSFETKRPNFLSCFAGQCVLVQCNVFVPLLSLSVTSVADWHTGQTSGIWNTPSRSTTLITFGIILFALITAIFVPLSPIPNRSHSEILQSEARFTVVPSSSTGLNTATGDMVEAAQDHSIYSSSVSALSSCHLNA